MVKEIIVNGSIGNRLLLIAHGLTCPLDRDENKTLKEIMHIMQEKYQFFAT